MTGSRVLHCEGDKRFHFGFSLVKRVGLYVIAESHLRLPYHKPAPKSLHDFMARAEKKREAYKVLRGARDIE